MSSESPPSSSITPVDVGRNGDGRHEPASPPPLRVVEVPEHPIVGQLRQDLSLGQGARRGGAWLLGSSGATQAFQFAISIVMARLLLPSQFGQAALVSAIAGFAYIFTDLGLTAAVIHARRVTEELLCSAFWLNAISGFVLTALLCAAAFPIAAAYGQPTLAPLFLIVSVNFTVQLGSVHLALLERTFRYRTVALVETLSTIAGFAAMPLLVLCGAGLFSIVLGPVITTTMLTGLLWRAVPWRPSRLASRRAVAQIWSFSRGLVGFNAINYWARNLDNVILGATVGDASLGEYNRAYNLMMIPVAQVGGVLMRGLYPALARMQDEPRRLGQAWIRTIAATGGAFLLPVSLTMAATAPAFVRAVYGPHWTGMVTTLEILALAAVPQMISASSGVSYRAADENGLMLKVGIVNVTSIIVAIVVGAHWGANGVATALLIVSCLTVPVAVCPLARRLGLDFADVVRPIAAGWLPCTMLLAAELSVRFGVSERAPAILVLFLQLAAGVTAHALVLSQTDNEIATSTRRTLKSVGDRARARVAPKR